MATAEQFTFALAQLAQARLLLRQSMESNRPQTERDSLLRAAQRLKNEALDRMM